MKNVRNKKFSIKNIITIFVVAIAVLIFLKAITSSNRFPKSVDQPINSQINSVNTHISRDLKIKFKYPKNWYIDDRYYTVLLTNYQTSLNKNEPPDENQIEISIKKASLCHSTIEEDLIYGGCGEGNKSTLNKILDKEVKLLPSGKLLIYEVKFSDNNIRKFHYLNNGEQILHISKSPSISLFDREFEDIIGSIKFL